MNPPPGLQNPPIAHRGLWRSGGTPENSLAAFEAACNAGYGIELDVRLSADGEAMVFHDDCLDRMTVESGLMEERTADDLASLRLLGSTQTIPTLLQALDLVAGRALVLVELKTPPGQEGLLEARVTELLASYQGPVGLLSFNADALTWMARHAPGLPRGLNIQAADQIQGTETACPDFLSVCVDLAGAPQVQTWRLTGRVVAWVARSPGDRARLRPLVDNVMFEGFNP